MKPLTDQLADMDDRPDLTPMIDCVFLLLLFFIVTSTFSEQTLFDVVLPKAAHAEQASTDEALIVTIAKDGRIAVGKEYLADNQLFPYLKDLKQRQGAKMLVVSGDLSAPYGKVVMCMDAARGLGFDDVVFVVQE